MTFDLAHAGQAGDHDVTNVVLREFRSRYSSSGVLTTGTNSLRTAYVSGRRRVPAPPARIIACIQGGYRCDDLRTRQWAFGAWLFTYRRRWSLRRGLLRRASLAVNAARVREDDNKLGAALLGTDRADRSAVRFDDLLHDREPEAAAAAFARARAVDLVEPFDTRVKSSC